MFSYSFSDGNTCNKCSLMVALEVKLSKLEVRFYPVEKPTAGQASMEPVAPAAISGPPADPMDPRPAG